MLASLLPGVRDLRAPLVAGYTWLVTLWLALADRVPDPGDARGVVADLYRLAEDAGRPATLAAVSVAAYLVGVLSVAVSSRLLLSPMLTARDPEAPSPRRHRPSRVGFAVLREAVLDQLDERYSKRPQDLAPLLAEASAVAGEGGDLSDPFRRRRLLAACVDVEWYQARLADDLELLPRRLLGEEKERELYAEFDRKKAEAEFRVGVALPAAALVTVLASRAAPWWLLALAVPVLLLIDAQRSERSAGDVLAEAVRARQSPTPAVTQLRGQALMLRPEVERLRRIAMGFPSATAQRALAKLLLQAGNVAGARTQLEMAVDRDDPAAMRELAELSAISGRDDEATTWYLRAARAGDIEAMVALAQRLKDDQLSEARRWLGEAAEQNHGGATFELGRLVAADGDYEQALQLFEKAERLGVADARAERGRLLKQLGHPEARYY